MAIMLRKPYKAPKSSKPRKVNKPCLSSSIAPHNPANAFLGPRRGSRDRSNALAKHGKHGKQQQQAYEAKQGNKALSYDLESLVDMTRKACVDAALASSAGTTGCHRHGALPSLLAEVILTM